VPRKRKNGERADGIAIDYRDHRASGACGLRDFAGAEPDINGGDYAGANAYDSPSAGYESGYGSGGYEGEWGSQRGGPHEEFDPDYQQWRREQMRTLDEDYRNWRQDRYKKFSDEFGQWRSSRPRSQTGSSSGSSTSIGSESGSSGSSGAGSTGSSGTGSTGSSSGTSSSGKSR